MQRKICAGKMRAGVSCGGTWCLAKDAHVRQARAKMRDDAAQCRRPQRQAAQRCSEVAASGVWQDLHEVRAVMIIYFRVSHCAKLPRDYCSLFFFLLFDFVVTFATIFIVFGAPSSRLPIACDALMRRWRVPSHHARCRCVPVDSVPPCYATRTGHVARIPSQRCAAARDITGAPPARPRVVRRRLSPLILHAFPALLF